MVPGPKYYYSAHIPGRYSKNDKQGRLLLLVRHKKKSPGITKAVKHRLGHTGEEVIQDRYHYGEDAQAIAVAQLGEGSRNFEIAGHDLVEKPDMPGHLPVFAKGSQDTYERRTQAIDKMMEHLREIGVSVGDVENIRDNLEIAAEGFWTFHSG